VPKTDLSNAGLSSSLTADATGGAAGWQGYTVRILPTTSASKMDTRPVQTGPDNSNQELLTSNASGSSSYHNPAGTQIGSATAANIELTDGQQYTDDLVITLTGASQESITNNLYLGPTVSGNPVSTFSKIASIANNNTYLTSAFDGMAFGWRETGGVASIMDVNSITVSASVSAPSILAGDMNFDGHVDAKDIAALEAALANPTAFVANNPGHGLTTSNLGTYSDVSGNGKFDNANLMALVTFLQAGHGSVAAVPEPTSFALLGLGAVAFVLARRRS